MQDMQKIGGMAKIACFFLDKFQQKCYNIPVWIIAKFSVLQASFSFVRKKEYANG